MKIIRNIGLKANLFKNMRIGVRLFSMISFVLLLIIIICVFGILKIHNMGIETERIVKEDMVLSKVITEITNNQAKQAIWLEKALRHALQIDKMPGARKNLKIAEAEFEKLSSSVRNGLKDMERHVINSTVNTGSEKIEEGSADILKKIRAIKKRYTDYENYASVVFKFLDQGNIMASEVLAKQMSIEGYNIHNELIQVIRKIEGDTKTSITMVKREGDVAGKGMVIVGLSAIFFAIIISLFITRSITMPLKKGIEAARYIAKGDFSISIEVNRKDETGQMLETINNMVEKLKNIIIDVKSTADTVSLASQDLSDSSEEMLSEISEHTVRTSQIATASTEMSLTVIDIANNATNIASFATVLQGQQKREKA